MRGMTWALIALLTASEAAAQQQNQGEERPEAVPPLPGSDQDQATPPAAPAPQGQQTPPTQENVIPQPVPDTGAGQGLDEQSQQPKFNRDATPQSTVPERQGQNPEDQNGVQEYRGPATGETAPEETPETRVPGETPDEEINPHGPIQPPPEEDEIPDRRFETFETGADADESLSGTPAMNPPVRQPKQQGTPPL